MRITDDQWVDIPEQTASTGAYSLSGGGLDQIATMGPTQGPVWDQAENAYYDMGASGLYSYDGGNSWEPKRAAPIPQSYSLNSPQLDQIATTPSPYWVDDPRYQGGGYYVDQWGNKGAGGTNSWEQAQLIPDLPPSRAEFIDNPQQGQAYDFNAPGFESPWNPDYQQPDQGGGFWNSAVHAVNDKLDYILPGTFDSRQKGIEEQGGIGGITAKGVGGLLSGNALIQGTTGYDPSTLPYGLGYITDVAAAPATYIGLGVGGGLGGTSWEVGKQIGSGVVGNLAAKAGMSDTAESIPYFGDQPAWLRGLEAGAIGGIGAYGALDAAPGIAKSAGPILKDFNASEAGEAFGTGIRRNSPEKRVVIDSAQEALNQGRLAPYPQPMANDRLWFHSTRDMKYDLPDPDMAVGTQTGITQGPGVYMAADPAKSAGNYGNRTFVTEFDGKVLDLTKQVTENDPIFAGGPSWAKIRDDLAAKLDAGRRSLGVGDYVRQAFDPKNLDAAQYTAKADLAAVARNADGTFSANSYVYKQALNDAVGRAVQNSGMRFDLETQKSLFGRFAGLAKESPLGPRGGPDLSTATLAIVQNHLADEGVDALFHHSPKADGDVLIVLNGKAARVVADVKNAPEAVKAGATLKDIKRGAVTQVVKGQAARGTVGPHPLGKEGEWWVYDPAGIQKGRILAPREAGDPFSVYMDGKGFVGMFDSFTEAKRVALGELPSNTPLMHPGIKSFLKGGEEGAVNLGDFAQGAKDVAGFAAPIAARTALGAGVGAAYGEASGMGWEKGAAIGGGVGLGFGVLGKVAGSAASRGVEARLAKNTRPEAADKLISLVKQAAPVRESQQELYSQELGRRAGELAKVQARRGGEQGFYEGMSALKGELPKATFNPVRPSMTADEITGLFNHVNDLNNMLPFTKMNTQAALVKVLSGELPTRGEISLLGKAFGDDFAKTLLAKRSLGAKAWENAVDALNLPRTLMTSWDASAPLRQGAILFAGHPIAGAKATGTMIRAMASPKYAELVRQQIENSPNATIYEKMGLYFADTTSSAALTAREEQIMSRLAGKIPGVGGSQRGYTTFLNKLRQDVADNFIAGNPNLSNKELKDFGHVINIMSGRGDLPKFLQDNSAILNAAFAPRYAMSRLQLPVEMVKAALPRALGGTTGAASKELARDVIAFAGTGAAILTLGKLAGVWNVELDPRSTDFGKGKMGNTRFDFWAGEQQIARYAAQLVGDPTRGVDSLKTGQRKTSTGQIVDANRLDTIGRWLQTKKSPAVGLATDLLQGKDFVGQPLDLKTKEGIGNQAWQRLAPLFLQDMADAAKLSGNQWRALSAGPSAIGAGVQTYQDSDYLKRQNYIKGQGNLSYANGDYYRLTKDDRQAVDDAIGKIPYANPQVRQALEAVTKAQQGADAELATGTFTPSKAQAWRDQYTTNKDNLRFFKDQVYADAGTKPGSDPQLDAYYKVIDQNTAQSGKVNWDAVDAYKKSLPDGGSYIDTHTGFLQIDTPTTRAFEKAKDTIETSGFFDKRDKAWAAIQAQLPEAKKYASYDEWYNAKLEAAQKEWAGQATPEYIDKEARKIIDKMAPAKGMKEYGNLWENGWIQANPAAAYLAWKWGYFVPTEEQAKWINNAVGAK